MAERSQYQYQPITGPVWRESVADKLAWLPSGQQPARGIPYSLPRSYVLDPIPPVDPGLLTWKSVDSYRGGSLPRALLDWSVYPPVQIAVPPYDPQTLEWMASGRHPQRGLPPNRIGDFVLPSFLTIYSPVNMEWLPSGSEPRNPTQYSLWRSYVLDPLPINDGPIPVVVSTVDPGDKPPRRRKSPHRGFDLDEWRKSRGEFDKSLEATIEKTWRELTEGKQPETVKQEAQSVVAPYVKTGKPLLPGSTEFEVDWQALARNDDAIEELAELDRIQRQRADDDEVITMLLLH